MAQSRSGPVRSEAARRSILTAAAQIFAERGYDHLTIEGIAARAGVGKQTIYRWWSSKSDIVADCLLEGALLPGQLSLPDTGDIRHDLTAWLRAIAAVMDSESGQPLIRSLIAAATENAEIGRRLRDSLADADSLADRLRVAAGTEPNLAAEAPFTELSEALVGAILLRVLSRSPMDDAVIDRLLVAILGPAAG
jgi:AcrR family transcriptional regulator